MVQELAIPGSRVGDNSWSDEDKVWIHCSSAWVPFSTFCIACASLSMFIPNIMSSTACLSISDASSRKHPAGLGMFAAVQCCIPSASRQAHSILELLHVTRLFQATDSRDRVYALIALARDEDRVLVPDYSVPTAQMLRELVRHLIHTDNNLMVLSGNRFPPLTTFDPSWVPHPEKFINTPKSDWQPEVTTLNASKSRSPEVTFSGDLRFLRAKGMIVDKIDTVIGPFEFQKFPGLFNEDLRTSAWTNSLEKLEQYGSSLSSNEREPFWRTLVLDSQELGHGRRISPAPKEIGEWFEIMLNGFDVSDAVRSEATKQFYAQAGFENRCFYVTTSGRKGVGPYGTLPRDLVTILYGGQFCYVLREVDERYVFVGDAYLHGAMHGELLDPGLNKARSGKYKEKCFVLS